MYALIFDFNIDDLKMNYSESYNKAYDEIRQELELIDFNCINDTFYVSKNNENSLTTVYKAINRLVKKSVRDIRVFKIENWSDFTKIVKG